MSYFSQAVLSCGFASRFLSKAKVKQKQELKKRLYVLISSRLDPRAGRNIVFYEIPALPREFLDKV